MAMAIAIPLTSGLDTLPAIAFFLGPRFEISLSQSLALMNGDWTRITAYPVALVLLVLAVGSVFWFSISAHGRQT